MKFTEAELIELENSVRVGVRVGGFFIGNNEVWTDAGGGLASMDLQQYQTFRRLIAFARASAVEPIAPFPALPEVRNGRNAGTQQKRKSRP